MSLLRAVLTIGRELDLRVANGQMATFEEGAFSWACKTDPANGAFGTGISTPVATAFSPAIIWASHGMHVLVKPPGWEVDGMTRESSGTFLLSSFVQRRLDRVRYTLVHTAALDYGFIHRLDVPSSGLILGGTNLEGLFHLKWQISVYAIDREYITMNHGPGLPGRVDVGERIDASTVETVRSTAHELGQPSRSWFSPLARLICTTVHTDDRSTTRSVNNDGGSGFAFSLLAVRIYTGRRHQIRAHTRHVGRPTVADALYAPRDVLVSGKDAGFIL